MERFNFRLKTNNDHQLVYFPSSEKCIFADKYGQYSGEADKDTWKRFIKYKDINITEHDTLRGLEMAQYIYIQSANKNKEGNKIKFTYGRRGFIVPIPQLTETALGPTETTSIKSYQIAIKVGIRVYILPYTIKADANKVNGNLYFLKYNWIHKKS